MRYFTPELFVRLQDVEDRAAVSEWDKASRTYAEYLEALQSRLPRSVRRFVKDVRLHDADVVSISRSGNTLVITVQPEDPSGDLLTLAYTLVEAPRLNRTALSGEHRTEHAGWLYDEITVARPRAPSAAQRGRRQGQAATVRLPTYTHDILLSNGWELHLRFVKFKLVQAAALLPSPPGEANRREEVMQQTVSPGS